MANEETTNSITAVVGHDNGDELVTVGDAPNEVVVYDYDKDGQFTGWHKQLVGGK